MRAPPAAAGAVADTRTRGRFRGGGVRGSRAPARRSTGGGVTHHKSPPRAARAPARFAAAAAAGPPSAPPATPRARALRRRRVPQGSQSRGPSPPPRRAPPPPTAASRNHGPGPRLRARGGCPFTPGRTPSSAAAPREAVRPRVRAITASRPSRRAGPAPVISRAAAETEPASARRASSRRGAGRGRKSEAFGRAGAGTSGPGPPHRRPQPGRAGPAPAPFPEPPPGRGRAGPPPGPAPTAGRAGRGSTAGNNTSQGPTRRLYRLQSTHARRRPRDGREGEEGRRGPPGPAWRGEPPGAGGERRGLGADLGRPCPDARRTAKPASEVTRHPSYVGGGNKYSNLSSRALAARPLRDRIIFGP